MRHVLVFVAMVAVGLALGLALIFASGCATPPRTRAERAREQEIQARRRVEIGAAQTYSMCRRATACSPIAEIAAGWCYERAHAECRAGGLPEDCWVSDVLLVEGPTDHRACAGRWP